VTRISLGQQHKDKSDHTYSSGKPRNFVFGGGFNKFSWGQRERGSGRRKPPSRGFWRQL